MTRHVVLQLDHQSHAHRLVLYHRHRNPKVFDNDACRGAHAIELGPRTNVKGRCLVLLTSVEAAPQQFVDWLSKHPVLSRRVFRVFWLTHEASSVYDIIGFTANYMAEHPGVLKLQIGAPAITHEVSAPKPKFEPFSKRPPESQAKPPLIVDVTEQKIGELMWENGISLNPKEFNRVLHVIRIAAVDFDDIVSLDNVGSVTKGVESEDSTDSDSVYLPSRLLWGFSSREASWTTQSDLGKISVGGVAKAQAKLTEALLVAGVAVDRQYRVVDVGASPGSWTLWLAERVKWVIALDPGKLSPQVAANSNVFHVSKKAEDFKISDAQIEDSLFELDLIVADMNVHPVMASKICLPLLQHLRPEGTIIMTMKFFGVGRDRTEPTEACRSIFGSAVESVECIWLFANTVNERVLVARRSKEPITKEQLVKHAIPYAPLNLTPRISTSKKNKKNKKNKANQETVQNNIGLS